MVLESSREHTSILPADTEGRRPFWTRENLEQVFLREAKELADLQKNRVMHYKKGLFLEKLWSSIDYLLEQGRVALAKKEGEGIVTNQEFLEELDRLFELVYRVKHPSVEDKVTLAFELLDFAGRAEIGLNELSPDLINEYADKNEEIALRELQRIKREAPPFWVKRKPGFDPEFDSGKVPPFTARSTLEDYRRLARKRVKPEQRKEESDIPVDYSLG